MNLKAIRCTFNQPIERQEIVNHFGEVLNKKVQYKAVLDPLVSRKFNNNNTIDVSWYICYALSQYINDVNGNIDLKEKKVIKRMMKEWFELFNKKTV